MTAATNDRQEPRAAGGLSLSAWCVVAAFGVYFCMYAFRKPFTAASFADVMLWGASYKVVLVVAQVFGYTVSKFIGIKVIAELEPSRRVVALLALVGSAELALLLFGLTPAPYNFIWLFFNGLPLGMVFGLVLGFLEGRRHTEALAAGLCTSFIVADGVVKSIGSYLLGWGVSQYWMPFAVGVLFVPPLLLFTWMLSRIPAPSAEDIAARSARAPMDRTERWRFFKRYAVGLSLMGGVYLLVTILRSARADFAPEIWQGLLGQSAPPGVFAASETVVGIVVLLVNGSVVFVRDNRRAFFVALGLAMCGAILLMTALVGLRSGLSPLAFMILHGLGLYLPYLAVHTTIFERLIAMTRDRGNVGYLLYLVDAYAYLGYVAVLIARNVFGPTEHFLPSFIALSWIIAVGCVVLLIPCWRYFALHPATQMTAEPQRVGEAALEGSV
jgi:hypothetical protein